MFMELGRGSRRMGHSALDPATWDTAEVEAYLRRRAVESARTAVTGTATHAMVVGSTGPFAQLAGRRALEAGGNAVDAAVTTALTQIALAVGSWVSYAGILTLTCFDATTGQVSTLSAGFGTFREETDPASIPKPPVPSGRTALVPGFLAGVETAHRRFGRLPWAALFQPAIFVAEQGLLVGRSLAWQFQRRADVLGRTPEGRAIFFDATGGLPEEGQTFRQPDLAATLRRVAADGTDYIYRGPWAAAFVDQVRRAGGQATLADLGAYRPLWGEPLHGTFRGYDSTVSGHLTREGRNSSRRYT